jgi:hypothetical protein
MFWIVRSSSTMNVYCSKRSYPFRCTTGTPPPEKLFFIGAAESPVRSGWACRKNPKELPKKSKRITKKIQKNYQKKSKRITKKIQANYQKSKQITKKNPSNDQKNPKTPYLQGLAGSLRQLIALTYACQSSVSWQRPMNPSKLLLETMPWSSTQCRLCLRV